MYCSGSDFIIFMYVIGEVNPKKTRKKGNDRIWRRFLYYYVQKSFPFQAITHIHIHIHTFTLTFTHSLTHSWISSTTVLLLPILLCRRLCSPPWPNSFFFLLPYSSSSSSSRSQSFLHSPPQFQFHRHAGIPLQAPNSSPCFQGHHNRLCTGKTRLSLPPPIPLLIYACVAMVERILIYDHSTYASLWCWKRLPYMITLCMLFYDAGSDSLIWSLYVCFAMMLETTPLHDHSKCMHFLSNMEFTRICWFQITSRF